MSTTTELLAANERYERLRSAVAALADEWVGASDRTWVANCGDDLRALLAAADA